MRPIGKSTGAAQLPQSHYNGEYPYDGRESAGQNPVIQDPVRQSNAGQSNAARGNAGPSNVAQRNAGAQAGSRQSAADGQSLRSGEQRNVLKENEQQNGDVKGEGIRTSPSEKTTADYIEEAREKTRAIRKSFEDKTKKNLYDATMDLMAIADTESEAALKAIHIRLLFRARALKRSESESSEVKYALRKINKVIGKVKTKIRKLKKEALLEKRRENARKAKQRAMEAELRRELALRRKVRKNRERKDVEDSKMGLGANDGGTGREELDLAQMEGVSLGSVDLNSAEIAAMSAGDGGAAAAVSDGGAEAAASIDISL